jgi:hypothetical protein
MGSTLTKIAAPPEHESRVLTLDIHTQSLVFNVTILSSRDDVNQWLQELFEETTYIQHKHNMLVPWQGKMLFNYAKEKNC